MSLISNYNTEERNGIKLIPIGFQPTNHNKTNSIHSNETTSSITWNEIESMITQQCSTISIESIKLDATRHQAIINGSILIYDLKISEDEAGAHLFDNLSKLLKDINPLYKLIIENNTNSKYLIEIRLYIS